MSGSSPLPVALHPFEEVGGERTGRPAGVGGVGRDVFDAHRARDRLDQIGTRLMPPLL